MTTFFNDTFTEAVNNTLLTSHTSDSGGTWAVWGGNATSPGVYTAHGGVICSGSGASQLWKASTIAPAADVKISWTQYVDSIAALSSIGAAARLNAAGNAGYMAVYQQTTSKWELYRLGAALATTLLAASSTYTLTTATYYSCELTVVGSGATVTLALKVNGVTVATADDTSASRVVAAGYPGVWFKTNAVATQHFIGSFSAGDAVDAATAPGAPVIGTATAGNGAATVTFTAPSSDGGSAITGYTATSSPGALTGTGASSPIAVAGLTNGTPYTFSVTATNAIGASAASAASNSVTPASGADITAPTFTGTVTVSGQTSGSGVLTWPTASDDVAVTGYEYSLNDGSTYTSAGNVLTITVTGLTASTSYPVRVRAFDEAANRSTHLSATLTTTAAVPQTYSSERSLQFADRVKDTTTTEGIGTMTLSNASVRTFASAYATGTKKIPYCIENAIGSEWESGEGTLLTATTLSRDVVFSSSSAGAKVSFSTGAKNVFCTVPARAVAAFAVKDYIDLRDFDVDPTFTADSTAGIQAAIIKAYDKNISRIKCPDGRFKIAGARGVSNAQLYIPNTLSTAPNRTIMFEGAAPPNLEMQGLLSMPVTTNGTIFESTIVGNAGSYLLRGEIGSASDPSGMRWNYTNIGFRNMGFRTKVDSGANPMSALGLDYFSQIVELDNIRVDVNMPIISCPNPSAVNSKGVHIPPINNHAQFNIGTILVAGYTDGVVFGEHTCAKSIIALGCVNAINLPAAMHGSYIGHLLVECSKNSIAINGNHALAIGCYSTEHNTDGNWFDFNSDINHYGGTTTRKVAILQATVVKSHVGIDDTNFVTNNVNCYKVVVGAGAN